MAKGKQTCKILKEIRKRIAEENDIELIISECTYKGDCKGTCPKCEAEVRYLERELEKRQRMGKNALVGGMALDTLVDNTSTGRCIHAPEPLQGIMPHDSDSTKLSSDLGIEGIIAEEPDELQDDLSFDDEELAEDMEDEDDLFDGRRDRLEGFL